MVNYQFSVFQNLWQSDKRNQVKSCTKHGRPDQYEKPVDGSNFASLRSIVTIWCLIKASILFSLFCFACLFVVIVVVDFFYCYYHYSFQVAPFSQVRTYFFWSMFVSFSCSSFWDRFTSVLHILKSSSVHKRSNGSHE